MVSQKCGKNGNPKWRLYGGSIIGEMLIYLLFITRINQDNVHCVFHYDLLIIGKIF